MKKSIRFNLFSLFAVIMVIFVLSSMVLNICMLDKYYVHQNRKIFDEVMINVELALDDSEKVQTVIEKIDRTEGISVTIADQSLIKTYTSFSKVKENNKLPREIETLIKQSKKNLKHESIYETVKNPESEQSKLVYIKMTTLDQYIILTKPLKGLQDSVNIANQFYMLVGFVALIIGSMTMFHFSDKVTKPICEMSEIAYDISKLKFGRKLKVNSKDELATLAQAINTLSDELEVRINALKDDITFQKSLSRNMSHELKTPIGVIKGYAEGLIFGVADNPEMSKRYLDTIVSECDRMDELVKDMLMLSQLSAQDYKLTNVETIDASVLIKDLIYAYHHLIETNGIKFEMRCEPAVKIEGNYNLLYRAVSNLISNAICYSNENKYIKLTLVEHEKIEISIYNTCSGIPIEEQAKIFDEFYKIDKVRERDKGGHGLGLSIVQHIVELHKGTISVENCLDGVAFKIVIPKNDSHST